MQTFQFTYRSLAGAEVEVGFASLQIVAEGRVQMKDGWFGERINYSSESGALIEFRSGPETIPSFEPSIAVEVTPSYVSAAYGISEQQLASIIGSGPT